MIAVAGKRRNNNIRLLKVAVLTMLMVTETAGDPAAAQALGDAFFLPYANDVAYYRENGTNYVTIQSNIAADATSWLDNSIASNPALLDWQGNQFPAGTTIRSYVSGQFDPPTGTVSG